MIPYPHIDPVIFRLGPLQVRWYGLMYLLGFSATWLLVRRQIRQFGLERLGGHFEDLNFVLIVGLVLGARLGYVLFYNLPYYLAHPRDILATWQGGMSFHGGLLGMVLGGYLFCRAKKLDFWQVADVYTVTAPVGLALGRIGNFINGELYGRVTDVPWAMVFPGGGPLPRHPSQLYECLLEGVVLFAIMWRLKNRRWPPGTLLAVFLILYGVFRWVVELFREPDPQLGFIVSFLTMGQLLCSAMVVGGALLLIWRLKAGKRTDNG
ncbi:MAG: prolipoprotein diacylglyceryl transferase [Desulfobacteraceae bacterium]|nr:prolipoprotein diacylglyceryl transferase [Desulfobacteraceae bacterium]